MNKLFIMFKTYGIYALVQKKITFTLQFFSILEISPLLLPWKKSAKRLQIPRVKNGLLNVGTCNAYIVLFIPSFFVHYQDKNVWIVI